ncbi:FMN-binding glutamate synthase family protein [Halomonas sp. SH5A2]|uniref:FMN-binding glutamate synthase family protein n=1 Tax=Halomonas sp. SH5A2 TaxID=2749040 RepID=UPI001641E622|nr:FMN-binding glutamate synthase family protein [Halomonas sp. SH5A2]QNI03899.1 FMN-binding glutamate synthase family protein [Halomonas sp. SH5A2]
MLKTYLALSTLFFAALFLLCYLWPPALWLMILVLPLFFLGLYDTLQKHHSLLRNFPLIGRGRWIMEALRPFFRQYFAESDTDGTPINRMFRNVVYQRAKGVPDAVPYGTRVDVNHSGYEWIGHSLSAITGQEVDELRVTIGGPDCRQPYSASILNISAMSFGALSRNAILALNRGANMGNFYHNTGEGGISPYHLEEGGDLVWQIGTGYFGCRTNEGNFDADKFREKAQLDTVKMIEIKLSQGAKPGHGGILPAGKNTEEIARIREVPAGVQVDSPPTHRAFNNPRGLMEFIAQLRELSSGKPIGFKLALGRESEFIALCKAMVSTGTTPDFITVDGGEGGTGAAPLEYTNSVGMPLREALAFVENCLIGFGLRERVKLIASGKVFTGFHLLKHLALGADLCNSARGMMLALGCVQSLTCHSDHCPTGVATQNPKLYKGLVVTDKAARVAQFHEKTLMATADLLGSTGLRHTRLLNRTHLHRRVSQFEIRRYDQIFPYVPAGSLLRPEHAPERYSAYLKEASPDSFQPNQEVTQIENSESNASDRKTEDQTIGAHMP